MSLNTGLTWRTPVLGCVLRFRSLTPMLQAALALAVAGGSKILFNSLLSATVGPARFADYASLVSLIVLVGSLSAAGSSAAVTLNVARLTATTGRIPRTVLKYLASLTLGWLVVWLLLGLAPLALGSQDRALAAVGVALICLYQVGRAFGYAVQRAGLVTVAESAGAVLILAIGLVAIVGARPVSSLSLVAVYLIGPLTVLAVLGWWSSRNLELADDQPFSDEDKWRAFRASTVFVVGAGSSVAMQYLPVLLSHSATEARAVAGILFGSLQATAPLLLLSRVYSTIMMPSVASSANESGVRRHLAVMRPLYLPTFAIALGIAPWVGLSLSLTPSMLVVSTAALVGVTTVFQVWASPAVTLLSASGRERVPAAASAAGLGLAALVWWAAAYWQVAILYPAGLAFGGAVRSLVPVWTVAGAARGLINRSIFVDLVGSLGIAASLLASVRLGTVAALAYGGALSIAGLVAAVRAWRSLKA